MILKITNFPAAVLFALVVMVSWVDANTYTDNFNRAALGSNWTTITSSQALSISSDTAIKSSAGSRCGAYYNLSGASDSQIVSANLRYGPYTFVASRVQSGSQSCYVFGYNTDISTISIAIYNNGDFTELHTKNQSITSNSLFSILTRSDTIIGLINGTPFDTVKNATLSSGYGGLFGYGSDPIGGFDNFSITDNVVPDSFTVTLSYAGDGYGTGVLSPTVTANKYQENTNVVLTLFPSLHSKFIPSDTIALARYPFTIVSDTTLNATFDTVENSWQWGPLQVGSSYSADVHDNIGINKLVGYGDTLVMSSGPNIYRSFNSGASWEVIDTIGPRASLVIDVDTVYCFYRDQYSTRTVYMVKYFIGAEVIPAPTTIHTYANESVWGFNSTYYGQSATINSAHELFVVVHAQANDTLFCLKSSDHGANWTNSVVSTHAYRSYPMVACGPDDSLYVVSNDYYNGNQNNELFIARSSDGESWTTIPILTDFVSVAYVLPLDNAGTLKMFLQSNSNDPGYGLYQITSTDYGTNWGAYDQIASTTVGYCDPVASLADDGTIFVIYRQNNSTNVDSQYILFNRIAMSTDGGDNWTFPFYDYTVSSGTMAGTSFQWHQGNKEPFSWTWMTGSSSTYYPFYNRNVDYTLADASDFTPPDSFTITVTHGSNIEVSPSTIKLPSGANQTFKITPSVGYMMDSVLIDEVNDGFSSPWVTFTNITANHTLRAVAISSVISGYIEKAGRHLWTIDSTVPTGCISPAQLRYLGAFKLPSGGAEPSIWPYGAYDLAYNPTGDPDGTDTLHGSLFGLGHTSGHMASEITIPQPKIDILANLNTATTIQSFANVGIGDTASIGLELVGNHLYVGYGPSYLDPGPKYFPSLSLADSALSTSTNQGKWYVGTDSTISGFAIFQIPSTYQSQLGNNDIITSRFKIGQGWGPNLQIFTDFQSSPPAAGSVITASTLMKYTEGSTHAMNDVKYNDMYRGIGWAVSGSKSAIIFSAFMGYKTIWYDHAMYSDSSMTGLKFYNPSDIISVYDGGNTYDPQPYATLDLTSLMYNNQVRHITSPTDHEFDVYQSSKLAGGAIDNVNGFMYVVEELSNDADAMPVVHVWKIDNNDSPPDSFSITITENPAEAFTYSVRPAKQETGLPCSLIVTVATGYIGDNLSGDTSCTIQPIGSDTIIWPALSGDKSITINGHQRPTYTRDTIIVGGHATLEVVPATLTPVDSAAACTTRVATVDEGYRCDSIVHYSGGVRTSAVTYPATQITYLIVANTIDSIFTSEIPAAQYTLTMATIGSGSVDPAGTTAHDSGVGFSLTATPATGYNFVNWTVVSGTAGIADSNDATTTCTLSTGNSTVTAIFDADTFYVARVGHAGGTVSSISPDSIFEYGDTVKIVINPDSGYYNVGSADTLTDTIKWAVTKDSVFHAYFGSQYTSLAAAHYGTRWHHWDGSKSGANYRDIVGDSTGTATTGTAQGTGVQGHNINCASSTLHAISANVALPTKFTISGFARLDAANRTSISYFYCQKNTNYHEMSMFYSNSTDRIYVRAYDVGHYFEGSVAVNSTNFPSGEEVYFAVEIDLAAGTDAARMKLFLNDQFYTLTYTGTAPVETYDYTGVPFRVGGDGENAAYVFKGTLDEITIWNDQHFTEPQHRLKGILITDPIIIVTAGQSNIADLGIVDPLEQPTAKQYYKNKAADSLILLLNAAAKGYSCMPKMGNLLSARYGKKILWVPAAYGGTGLVPPGGSTDSVYYWHYRPANHNDRYSRYGFMLTQIDSVLMPIDLVVWAGGEQDFVNHIGTDTIADCLSDLRRWLNEDLGYSVPWAVNIMGTTTNTGYDSIATGIRNAVISMRDSTGFFIGSNAIDYPRRDVVHYDSVSYEKMGKSFAWTFMDYLGDTTFVFPTITGNQNKLLVSEPFIPDTTPTGLYGHEVSGGTWVVPDTITKSGDTLIPVWINPVDSVRYMYGQNPTVSGAIKSAVDPYEAALPYVEYYGFSIEYSVTGTDVGNGSHAFLPANDSVAESGGTVSIYGTADAGNVFSGLSGDTAGMVRVGDTATFTMTANRAVTLKFTAIPVIDSIRKNPNYRNDSSSIYLRGGSSAGVVRNLTTGTNVLQKYWSDTRIDVYTGNWSRGWHQIRVTTEDSLRDTASLYIAIPRKTN